MSQRFAILGTGVSGCGAARYLTENGIKPTVYDKNKWSGGHTASTTTEGFVFDEGPHISFTKEQRIQELFARNVSEDYQVIYANINNYWQGHWLKHPAQCNLHGLPADLIVKIIVDFVKNRKTEQTNISNYADWLVAAYGETFAKTFPMQYGLKYHTIPAENMTTDWLGPRLYRPILEEILFGAIAEETPDVHYVSNFRYPTHGGFVSYVNPFLDNIDTRLSHELVRLNTKDKVLFFSNGLEVKFDQLISSIPLPELIPLIDNVPDGVRVACSKLAATSCVLVNLGIERTNFSKAHWTYFYDSDYTITRMSCPHLFSEYNTPPGCGSIQAEVYFSKKYKPLTNIPDYYIDPVIEDLIKCGLLNTKDNIVYRESKLIEYANIIFDHDRNAALKIVHEYLKSIDVFWCGRYGEWGYEWTDESFLSGEKAAELALINAMNG